MQHLQDTQVKRTVSMFLQKELDQKRKNGLQQDQSSLRCWNRVVGFQRRLMRETLMGESEGETLGIHTCRMISQET